MPKLSLFPDSRTLTRLPPKEQNQVEDQIFKIISSNQYLHQNCHKRFLLMTKKITIIAVLCF